MTFSLKEQLAAALCRIGQIPHGHQKLMSADQVISLFHRDHYPIRKADGGPDIFWNCYHRFIGEHRHKTSTVDLPQIAKRKRIQAKFQRPQDKWAITEGRSRDTEAQAQLAGRPSNSRWPQGRKIPSRLFQKRMERRS